MKNLNLDELFSKFGETARSVTKNVVVKANDTVESAKISWAISEAEKKIEKLKLSIGDVIYDEYLKSKDFAGVIGELCDKIDNLNDEIETMLDKKAEVKNEKRCDVCGAFNKINGVFCSVCGEKLGNEGDEYGEEI